VKGLNYKPGKMIKMDEVKNILFDLGGVLIDVETSRSKEAMNSFLGKGQSDAMSWELSQGVFLKHETGEINSDEFVKTIRDLANGKITELDVIMAWNSMLVQIPIARVNMLKILKTRFNLYVLSNTNQLHVDCFERMAPGVEKFSGLFDRVYYSHLIGGRKPDERAFRAVIEDSGIKPGETLFVDDLADNVSTAFHLGFKCLHLTQGIEISDWFASHGYNIGSREV